MDKRITGLLLLVGIIVVCSLIYTKVSSNNKNELISEFNEKIMTATEIYIKDNFDKYPEFKNKGDSIDISVEQLIKAGNLTSDIDNPTDKSFSNIMVRLTIEGDSTIKYKVL